MNLLLFLLKVLVWNIFNFFFSFKRTWIAKIELIGFSGLNFERNVDVGWCLSVMSVLLVFDCISTMSLCISKRVLIKNCRLRIHHYIHVTPIYIILQERVWYVQCIIKNIVFKRVVFKKKKLREGRDGKEIITPVFVSNVYTYHLILLYWFATLWTYNSKFNWKFLHQNMFMNR